jgi:hypothetical protein
VFARIGVCFRRPSQVIWTWTCIFWFCFFFRPFYILHSTSALYTALSFQLDGWPVKCNNNLVVSPVSAIQTRHTVALAIITHTKTLIGQQKKRLLWWKRVNFRFPRLSLFLCVCFSYFFCRFVSRWITNTQPICQGRRCYCVVIIVHKSSSLTS